MSRDIRQPLYMSVYGTLREGLHGGSWQVGASLPSELDLSDRFKVSRITVRHALRLLETDGYIRKARAQRPVVVRLRCPAGPIRMAGRIDRGHRHDGGRCATGRAEVARDFTADVALLGLPAASTLHCLRSILVRHGKPYARSIIYFPPAIASRLRRNAFDDAVVFRVLHRELGIRLDDVRLTVWAEPANSHEPPLPARGAPLLVTQLLYRDDAGTGGARLQPIACIGGPVIDTTEDHSVPLTRFGRPVVITS